ncbi:hypothetical protein ONZ45_g17291 [Pleurotus djamor]|nr:hypothetical protein ONZ45_g17291 [Pleurotus djamor]
MEMNRPTTESLRIRQMNIDKSRDAALTLINSNLHEDFDIILIQEPYLDFQGLSRANRRWKLVYPSKLSQDQVCRSLIMVNNRINTDDYEQIAIPDTGDVTAIKVSCNAGPLYIFNIYNDCQHNRALELVRSESERLIDYDLDPMIVWAGDFNRHHELWDNNEDFRLFTAQARRLAQPLVDMLGDFGMEMALEKGAPTLRHKAWKSHIRVDNVFVSEDLADRVLVCETKPGETLPGADHYPIDTIIDLYATLSTERTTKNFRNVDWKEFSEKLGNSEPRTKLPLENPPTPDDIEAEVESITSWIQTTINEVVKDVRKCPYTRRWWNEELERLRKARQTLKGQAYRERNTPLHPVHEELRRAEAKYRSSLRETKRAHWENYLEELDPESIWTANKYLSNPATDGASSRVPSLTFEEAGGRKYTATSNEDKGRRLAQMFFPPKPDGFQPSIPRTRQPEVNYEVRITMERVTRTIGSLKPFKVPGPDGIPNIVLMRAIFDSDYYPKAWRRWTTVVLKKPGKPRYDVAKAWRPVALLNTMGKVMTALVTEDIVHICETSKVLPQNHFGGRPGRSTSDALHYLTTKIKDAWRKGKVVSVLFLDIEAAFPNAVTDQLIINLQKRGIPASIIRFVRNLLTDRQTTMVFDDFTSDWINIDNGIGQGDPISMILYLFYNADLLEIPYQQIGEDAIAYVDDASFIAVADDFTDAHNMLRSMMVRPDGGYDWSQSHNSRFETSKLRLMDFSPTEIARHPKLTLNGTNIKREKSYKLLGITLDENLRWHQQTAAAVERTTKWVNALRRLGKTNGGVSSALLRRLYLAVAIPKMTYALDVWYTPPHLKEGAKNRRGSIRALQQLEKDSPPLETTLEFICHRNALRVAASTGDHPVTRILMDANKANMIPVQFMEGISTISSRKVDDTCPIGIVIPKTREDSKANEKQSEADHRIYVDGSGFAGNAAGAMVRYKSNDTEANTSSFTLGPLAGYTTFDAEAIGLLLAADEIRKERLSGSIAIFMDNKSVIQRLQTGKRGTGQYILDAVEETLTQAKDHDNVKGNERADKLAKEAAEGEERPPDPMPKLIARHVVLPQSKSAWRQAAKQRRKERSAHAWSNSTRKASLDRIDKDLTEEKFIKQVGDWRKNRVSIITQLRTRHIPLNLYLHRIGRAETPWCPHCPRKRETVFHFLKECPAYSRERRALASRIGNDDLPLKVLLADPEGMKATIDFVGHTKRMLHTHGNLDADVLAPGVAKRKEEKSARNGGKKKARGRGGNRREA